MGDVIGAWSRRGVLAVVALGSVVAVTSQSASAEHEAPVAPTTVAPPTQPVPAPAPTMEPNGLGTNGELDSLASACFNGSMQACDDLYEAARQDPANGDTYTMYGDTCAGRQPRGTGLLCTAVFVDGPALGQPAGTVPPAPSTSPTPTTAGMYASCEEALQPPDSGDPCSERKLEAYANFGSGFPTFYAALPGLTLGEWTPTASHATLVNFGAIMACQLMLEDSGELAWVEYVHVDGGVLQPTMADNEALFDAAMANLCPQLGYRRQFEWDSYVPFDPPPPNPSVTTTTVAP